MFKIFLLFFIKKKPGKKITPGNKNYLFGLTLLI